MSEMPKNLEEAVGLILVEIPPALIEDIKNTPQDELFLLIDTMEIRNAFGLWGDNTELREWFFDRDITHADDMSDIIVRELWCRCVGEGHVDIEENAKKYKEHWKKMHEELKETPHEEMCDIANDHIDYWDHTQKLEDL